MTLQDIEFEIKEAAYQALIPFLGEVINSELRQKASAAVQNAVIQAYKRIPEGYLVYFDLGMPVSKLCLNKNQAFIDIKYHL